MSQIGRDPREASAGAVAARALRATVMLLAAGAVGALLAALAFVAAASGQAVAVDFNWAPAAPKAGAQVTFTSTSSLQRPIVREDWDFDGDGQPDATGRSVTHTFTSPGSHRVTLLVHNDRGRIRGRSKLVNVSSASPPAPPPRPAPPPPVSPPPPPAPPSTAPAPIPPAPPAPVPAPATGATGAPQAIVPFPVVRITGTYTRRGVRLRLLTVTTPAGVRITVRCRGGGCPYRRSGPFVVRASGARPGAVRYVRIKGFRGRLLKPGVRLQVFVAQRDRIGKYTSFRIRRGHSPQRTDSCLRPGGASVVSCG